MEADKVLASSQVSESSSSCSRHPEPQALVSGSAINAPTIGNVVSTVNLACKLDLKAIAIHEWNVEYNPKKFDAVIMKIKEPKTTAIIFSNGKMICTGAITEEQSLSATRKHARIIKKLGFDVKFESFKIQNIVASYDFTSPLSLTKLANSPSKFSIYEPELFPG